MDVSWPKVKSIILYVFLLFIWFFIYLLLILCVITYISLVAPCNLLVFYLFIFYIFYFFYQINKFFLSQTVEFNPFIRYGPVSTPESLKRSDSNLSFYCDDLDPAQWALQGHSATKWHQVGPSSPRPEKGLLGSNWPSQSGRQDKRSAWVGPWC